MSLRYDAVIQQLLAEDTLSATMARLDRALKAAHAVAEHDSPVWHLLHEARTALHRLAVHLDREDA